MYEWNWHNMRYRAWYLTDASRLILHTVQRQKKIFVADMKHFLCLDLVAAIDEILILHEWDMTCGGGGGCRGRLQKVYCT